MLVVLVLLSQSFEFRPASILGAWCAVRDHCVPDQEL